MTSHLLLVALGPVQEFIAQSRRTRDLWHGSHLLSELSRACARSLAEAEARLVFPALDAGDPELIPCPTAVRPSGHPPLNIANKVLAELPPGLEPERLARDVRAAVGRFWREAVAAPVKRDCAPLIAAGTDEAWEEQIASFLEFSAAWAPLGDYCEARTSVERAVSSRKNLRDFTPWERQRGKVPKSSLDGARETVLRPPRQRDEALARQYRIAAAEQLDAVGLVKRAGGAPNQFVPIVNVALSSWTAYARTEASSEFERLLRACDDVGLARVVRADLPCARSFPYDASVLLRSRWWAVFEEQGLGPSAETWGARHVAPLLERLGEPNPYVACLVADGDHVGGAIDGIDSPGGHRAFSRNLSRFASDARRIVEQRHFGSLVYAGGDDVLAFVPVPEAVRCADALRVRFAEIMSESAAADPPTLSVGLGVGHVMESMGDLLSLGRDAERLAKRGDGRSASRNALAIVLDKRSGGRRVWRRRWDHPTAHPARQLLDDAKVLRERLSSKKVYDVARTLQRLPSPDHAGEPGWGRVLAMDVRRSLLRSGGDRGVEPADVGLLLDVSSPYAALHAEVLGWVERMLIARSFASAEPQRSRQAKEVA